ncbi:MAG: glycosyltransferase family 2 protein, partial [Actinomycetota bacterium]
YGVEQYLPECLDSVLAAPAAGLEVIAIDDASPDGCGELLDARAKLDPRLQVVHLPANLGPGHGRNLGLAMAAGDYVWFVDGDDTLPAGALAAVAARLTADLPDLLLIDYADRYPDGSSAPSPGAALLRAAPPGSFTLAQQPHLVNLTMTAWSKVFGRAFLQGLGVPFPAGIHEDILVTCSALLAAGRIAALVQPCYQYRRARPGSFMVTTSRDHLAIFESYRQVFELAASRLAAGDPGLTAAVQAALFERAIWHYTTILQPGGVVAGALARGGVVPRGERRAFFARMHSDFLRYRPASYRTPAGARGAKFRLVERGAYRTYTLLEPVNAARVRLRRAAAARRPGRVPAGGAETPT